MVPVSVISAVELKQKYIHLSCTRNCPGNLFIIYHGNFLEKDTKQVV